MPTCPRACHLKRAAATIATLGGAVATVQAHPGPAGDALLALSRTAFTTSMQARALLAALTGTRG